MDIVISDFDNTLFKRYHGIIRDNVDYIVSLGLPVFIVSYRGLDQEGFIRETLDGTDLNVLGLVLLGDRKQDPQKKFEAALYLTNRYSVEFAFDDDAAVMKLYNTII